MRILHLVSNWKLTGPVAPAIELAAALRARGHDVDVALGRPLDKDVAPAGDHARGRGLPVVDDLVLSKHFRVLDNARDVRRLRRLIAQEGYEILHAHGTNDHLLATVATRRGFDGIIVRSTYYGTADRIRRRDGMLLRRSADAVVVPGAIERDWALGQRPDLASHMFVSAGAVDLERFDASRVAPDRPADEPAADVCRVGIVARVQTHRRWEDVLSAVGQLQALRPHVKVVVIGRGTNFDRLLREPIARAGLESHIELAGYRTGDDYVSLLAGLDAALFLVPGSDGTCRAVRELMAMGLAMIVADAGILPELVDGGEAGLVLDGPGPAPLAAAMKRLAEDVPYREGLGKAARARAASHFDLARYAAHVEALYQTAGDGA